MFYIIYTIEDMEGELEMRDFRELRKIVRFDEVEQIILNLCIYV